jgi:hypothetical protein
MITPQPPYYRSKYPPERLLSVTHPLGATREVEAAAGRASIQAELFTSDRGWRFLKIFVFDTGDERAGAYRRLRLLEGVTVEAAGNTALDPAITPEEERVMMQPQDETLDVAKLVTQALALDPDKMLDLVRELKRQAKYKKEAAKHKDDSEIVEAEKALSQAEFDQQYAFDSAQALQIEPLREKLRRLGVADRTQSRATREWRKIAKELRKRLISQRVPPGEQLEAEMKKDTSDDTMKNFPMEAYGARLSTANPEQAALVGGRWHIDYATGAWTFTSNAGGGEE